MAVELDHFLCGENLNSAQGSRGVYQYMVRHPRGNYMVLVSKPIALWKRPYQKIYLLIDAVIRMKGMSSQKGFLVGCSSPFMRLAQHLAALCAWRKQCLPGP